MQGDAEPADTFQIRIHYYKEARKIKIDLFLTNLVALH